MTGPRSIRRPALRPAAATAAAMMAILAGGCGGKINVDEASHSGAQIFNERCSGCHSLDSANAYGSKPKGQLAGGERTNGPNFNVRKENSDDVLYAIRNGGFSGAIMPANILTGRDAEKVAEFLGEYSGKGPK